MAVHHCCVPLQRGPVSTLGVPETACASVASSPIEEWHLRHVKHDVPCRKREPRAILESGLTEVDVPLVPAALPRPWVVEFVTARRALATKMRPLLGESVDTSRKIWTTDFHPG